MTTVLSPIDRTDIRHREGGQSAYVVILPSGTKYVFYVDADLDLYWTKSADNGLTWSLPVLVKAGTIEAVAVWYDRWSSINADLIHLAYIEAGADDVFYRNLDAASSDTLSTETTIFVGLSALSGTATKCISLTRARGGNLLCAFDIDGGTETGFYRSVDAGANWTARTDVNEATSDYYLLGPGFAADNQDILCIYWDRSADEISRKIYDDSADTWAETSIATTMVDIVSTTCISQFALAPDLSNSQLLVAAWSNRDLANADLRFFKVSEAAITEMTNVVLNSTDDQQMCAVALDTSGGTVYVLYGGKSDGSETAGTAINLYYKTSADLGANWGSETALTTTALNFAALNASPNYADHPSFMVREESLGMLYAYSEVSLSVGGAGGGAFAWVS